MRISAKADYAIRAAVELAAAGKLVKAEQVASAQKIPPAFLLNMLVEMKRNGLVRSQRGAEGGYELSRRPEDVTLADIIRAVEGPLAQVGDSRPEELRYQGLAQPLQRVWVALRANLRVVLEEVTLAHLLSGNLPPHIEALAQPHDAWESR